MNKNNESCYALDCLQIMSYLAYNQKDPQVMFDHQNQGKETVQRTSSAETGGSGTGASLQAPGYQVSTAAAEGAEACGSYEDLVKVIEAQADRWGTDEDAIYSAIRCCPEREKLKWDMIPLNKLKNEMSGHDLWKAYLLIDYGSEGNFPKGIQDIWDATKGMGTDEDKIMDALKEMSASERNTFGLGYILCKELSGDDQRQALALMNSRDTGGGDSIEGNLFGVEGAADGEYEFNISGENAIELIGADFQGNGTELLKNAMILLYGRPGGALLQSAIADVAAARGIDEATALEQYHKAMRLRDEGIAYYREHFEEKHGEAWDPVEDHPSPVLSADNMDFTATNAQLTFGKVVGDVFGIDAVFGCLISPTGGMAGGGNSRIPFVEDGSAVSTHGAVHDAGGYLKNCHNIGPGYDYFNNEEGADQTHHLAGQTNIQWWFDQYEAKGLDIGMFEKLLNSQSYKGAAFAKDYSLLDLEGKKESLKVMCSTGELITWQLDISPDDRLAIIQEMIEHSTDEERTAIAEYYFANRGFGVTRATGRINNFLNDFR